MCLRLYLLKLRFDSAKLDKIDNKDIHKIIICSAGKNCSLPFLCICSQSRAHLVLNKLHSCLIKEKSWSKGKNMSSPICITTCYLPKIKSCALLLAPVHQGSKGESESVESCCCYCFLGLWKRWSTSSWDLCADLYTA